MALASFFLVFPASSLAAADELASTDEMYFHRDQPGKLEEHIKILDDALASRPHDQAYLWRRCRALVRRGERQIKKPDRLADYDLARKDCEKAVALISENPASAVEAHFWLGVAMGRWGEAKGMMSALFMIKPIKREMAETLRLDPNHGGAHHVLGEILWQVPGFVGGNKKQALAEFEAAVKTSPTYTANYQPLAVAYLYFKRKEDAVRVLRAVETIKEPADPAEYADNLADARKLLAQLGL